MGSTNCHGARVMTHLRNLLANNHQRLATNGNDPTIKIVRTLAVSVAACVVLTAIAMTPPSAASLGEPCAAPELETIYAAACGQQGRPTQTPCSNPAGGAGCPAKSSGACRNPGQACGPCTGGSVDWECAATPNQPASHCSIELRYCCSGNFGCQTKPSEDNPDSVHCSCDETAAGSPGSAEDFRKFAVTDAYKDCCAPGGQPHPGFGGPQGVECDEPVEGTETQPAYQLSIEPGNITD